MAARKARWYWIASFFYRMTLYSFSLSILMVVIFITGNYQDFTDSNLMLVLNITATFSGMSFLLVIATVFLRYYRRKFATKKQKKGKGFLWTSFVISILLFLFSTIIIVFSGGYSP